MGSNAILYSSIIGDDPISAPALWTQTEAGQMRYDSTTDLILVNGSVSGTFASFATFDIPGDYLGQLNNIMPSIDLSGNNAVLNGFSLFTPGENTAQGSIVQYTFGTKSSTLVYLAAVGGTAGTNIAYSYDGSIWTSANISQNSFNGFASNTSLILALGGAQAPIVYSTNGVSWTASSSAQGIFGASGCATSAVWNGSYWIAVGYSDSSTICVKSSDGITWTQVGNLPSLITQRIITIQYANSVWVAAGVGANSVTYSADGETWYPSTSGNMIINAGSATSILYTNSKWFMGVTGGNGTACLATSQNGNTWTSSTTAFALLPSVNSLATNGSIIVAVGSSIIYSNNNGITWFSTAPLSVLAGQTLTSVTWNGNTFMVGSSIGVTATSPDGIQWSSAPPTTFANGNPITDFATFTNTFGSLPTVQVQSTTPITLTSNNTLYIKFAKTAMDSALTIFLQYIASLTSQGMLPNVTPGKQNQSFVNKTLLPAHIIQGQSFTIGTTTITPTMRGVYNPAISYHRGDLVYYPDASGSLNMCLIGPDIRGSSYSFIVGVEPVENPFTSPYWYVVVNNGWDTWTYSSAIDLALNNTNISTNYIFCDSNLNVIASNTYPANLTLQLSTTTLQGYSLFGSNINQLTHISSFGYSMGSNGSPVYILTLDKIPLKTSAPLYIKNGLSNFLTLNNVAFTNYLSLNVNSAGAVTATAATQNTLSAVNSNSVSLATIRGAISTIMSQYPTQPIAPIAYTISQQLTSCVNEYSLGLQIYQNDVSLGNTARISQTRNNLLGITSTITSINSMVGTASSYITSSDIPNLTLMVSSITAYTASIATHNSYYNNIITPTDIGYSIINSNQYIEVFPTSLSNLTIASNFTVEWVTVNCLSNADYNINSSSLFAELGSLNFLTSNGSALNPISGSTAFSTMNLSNSAATPPYLNYSIGSNQQNHFAWVRNSSNLNLYVNGYSVYNTTSATTPITGSNLFIGADPANGTSPNWKGGLRNFRVDTSAIYTSNFNTSPIITSLTDSVFTSNLSPLSTTIACLPMNESYIFNDFSPLHNAVSTFVTDLSSVTMSYSTMITPFTRVPYASSYITIPHFPTSVAMTAWAYPQTSVTATWAPSPSAISYTVNFYYSTTNITTGGTLLETITATGTTATTTTAIANGLFIYAVICANNSAGSSIYITTPTTTYVDQPPTNVLMSPWTNSQTTMTVTWTAAPIQISYTVSFYTNSTSSTTGGTLLQTFTGVSGTSQTTSSTLVYGTYYYATVVAITNVGNSTTTTSSNVLQFNHLPLNPSAITMTPVPANTNVITASWAASSYSQSYTVSFYSNPTNLTSGGTLLQTFTGITGTSVTTTATLTAAGYYYVTVTGVNPTGSSSSIAATAATFYTPVCGAVTNQAMASYVSGSTSMTVTWTTAPFVTTYIVTFYSSLTNTNSGGTVFQTFNSVSGSATSQTSSTTLVQGNYYYATVQGINANLNSAIVTTPSAVWAIALPSSPTGITMTNWAIGITVATVSWSAATRATTYTVSFYSVATNTTTGGTLLQTITGITALTYSTPPGLSPLSYYYATVTSVNTTGPSSATTSSNTMFYNPSLPPPSTISISISSNTLTTSWVASPSTYGIPSYTLAYYTSTSNFTTGGTLLSTITDISPLSNSTTFSNLSYRNFLYATVVGNIPGLSSIVTSTLSAVVYLPTSFLPNYIPNLSYWFDAADGATVSLSGSNLSSWTNKGLVGGSATPVGTIPLGSTFNSLNTLNFNSQQYMTLPSYTGSATGTSMFVVMKATSNLAASSGYYPITNTGGPDLSITNTTNVYYGQNSAAVLFLNSNTTNISSFTGSHFMLSSVENGTTTLPSGFWNNGSNIALSSGTGTTSTTFTSPTLGTSSASIPFQLAEVIIYTSNLPYTSRQTVEGYLAWKWGLQSSLPYNHPYYTSSSGYFNPLALSGLQLWLDATDPSASGQDYADGASLTTWNDKSGKGRSATLQTTGSGTITSSATSVNNLNTVYFNSPSGAGVRGYSSIPSGTFSSNYTTFTVYKLNSFTTNPTLLSRAQTLYNQYGETRYVGNMAVSDTTTNSNNWILTSNLNVNTLTTVVNYPGGSNISYSENLNGSPLSLLVASSPVTIPAATSILDTSTYLSLTNSNASALYSQIDIRYCEVLVFNANLSVAQRQQVEGYLALKWGTQSELPLTHPYRTGLAPILPSQFPGNQIWLDGTDPLGTGAAAPATLTTWYDKSGLGQNLVMSNSQSVTGGGILSLSNTTYGQGMVVPPSSSGLASVGPNTFIKALSFFVVYKSLTNIGSNALLSRGSQGTPMIGPLPAYTTTTLIQAGATGVGTSYTANNIYNTNTSILYTSMNQSSNTITQSLNGTFTTISGITAWTPTDTTSVVKFFDTVTGGCQFNGIVYEILVYNRAFSTEQRTMMEGYLASKWNLQNMLPVLHPYRAMSPMLAPTYDFTPECLPSLQLWLDGSDPLATGITPANGSIINTWYDKSDLMNHAIGSNSPTMSSSGITFNGSNQSFVTPYIAYSSAETGFLIVNMTSPTTNCPFLSGTSSNTSRNFWGELGSRFVFGLTANTTSYTNFTTTNSYSTTYLLSYTYNYSGITGYQNGSFMGSNATNLLTKLGLGSGTSNPTIIGASVLNNSLTGTVSWMSGTISEIVVYNSVLSSTQRQQVEGYLSWKWGLNSQLPTTHPYYYLPPQNTIYSPSRTILAPQNLALQFAWGAGLSLSWTPSSNAEFYQFMIGGYVQNPISQTLSNVLLGGLTQNTSYTVQVVAKNSYGSASSSITVSTVFNFNPRIVSGIQGWYDAADIMGNGTSIANGTAISSWYDKSGFAYNMTATGSPILTNSSQNYLPGITFSGSSGATPNMYYTATFPANTFLAEIDTFIVYKNTSSVTYNTLFTKQPLEMYNTYLNPGSYTNPYNVYNTSISIFNLNVSQATTATTSMKAYTNGNGITYTGGTTWTPADTDPVFYLGTRAGGTLAFNGVFYEVLVFNSQLTTLQRQTVEGYLAWKWGLQSQLPSFNSYSTKPPTSSTNFSTAGVPQLIPGLQLWLDATDIYGNGTSPANGASITTWADKSGLGYNATVINTGSNIAAFSSSPLSNVNIPNSIVIRSFIPPSTFTKVFTSFVIYNSTGQNGMNEIFSRSLSGNTSGNPIEQELNNFYIGLNNVTRIEGISTWNPYSPSVNMYNLIVNQTANTLAIVKNATSVFSTSSYAWTPSDIGNMFTLGGRSDGNYANMNVYEVVLFNTVLSTSQTLLMEGYLAWKWGLQTQLPTTHPFYTIPVTSITGLSIASYTSSSITVSWIGAIGTTSYTYKVNGTTTTPSSDNGIMNKMAKFTGLSIKTTSYTIEVTSTGSTGSSVSSILLPSLDSQYLALPSAAIYLNGLTYNGSSTWVDSSPNGVNASLVQGTAAKNSSSNGVLFNGLTYWSFPDINLGNAWTICIWVKNLNLNQGNILTQTFGNYSSIIAAFTDYSVLSIGFWNNSIGNPGFVFPSYTNSPTASITTNTWTYVQATWNGTNLINYINGAQYGPTVISASSSKSGNTNYLIGRRYNGDQSIYAEIGEIRIFRSALTDSQISLLYNYTKPNFT